MSMGRFTVVGLCCALLGGCVQDPSSPVPNVPTPSAKGVYILNEGNFGRANSTLSYYDLESFRVEKDVFFSVNNKVLGDVGNSMLVHGGFGYVIVNNSHKIEIIELATHRNVGTINVGAGKSPRQMVLLNDSTALVTALYDASVLKVDLKNKTVLQRIPVGANPEGIAVAAGKAFVANSGLGRGRTVSIINLASFSVARTLVVGDNPVGVQVTPSGFVYVVCVGFYNDLGNPNDDTPARITVINPTTDTVVDSTLLGGHGFKIAVSAEGKGYAPTTLGVVAIDTRIHRVTGIFKQGEFYSIGIEEASGDIYLADAKNYIQPGTVFVYASATGGLRTQFDVGLIPGTIVFKR